jgi:hypothetical protein
MDFDGKKHGLIMGDPINNKFLILKQTMPAIPGIYLKISPMQCRMRPPLQQAALA